MNRLQLEFLEHLYKEKFSLENQSEELEKEIHEFSSEETCLQHQNYVNFLEKSIENQENTIKLYLKIFTKNEHNSA